MKEMKSEDVSLMGIIYGGAWLGFVITGFVVWLVNYL